MRVGFAYIGHHCGPFQYVGIRIVHLDLGDFLRFPILITLLFFTPLCLPVLRLFDNQISWFQTTWLFLFVGLNLAVQVQHQPFVLLLRFLFDLLSPYTLFFEVFAELFLRFTRIAREKPRRKDRRLIAHLVFTRRPIATLHRDSVFVRAL